VDHGHKKFCIVNSASYPLLGVIESHPLQNLMEIRWFILGIITRSNMLDKTTNLVAYSGWRPAVLHRHWKFANFCLLKRQNVCVSLQKGFSFVPKLPAPGEGGAPTSLNYNMPLQLIFTGRGGGCFGWLFYFYVCCSQIIGFFYCVKISDVNKTFLKAKAFFYFQDQDLKCLQRQMVQHHTAAKQKLTWPW